MVRNQRHRMKGIDLHQRIGENLAHVIIATLAGRFVKLHLQRGIKQHGFPLDLVNIGLQFIDIMGPVFRDDKQRPGCHLLDVLDPLFIEPCRDMFDGIQAKTIAMGLIHHPACPVFELFSHGMIAKIDIFAHQIVKVAQFVIDLIVPAFAGIIIHDFKNAVLGGIFNMIDAAKAFVVPNELRVLTRTGREGVPRPGLAFDNLIVNLRAVIGVYALNLNVFFLVGPHFVVDHHIQQYRDIVVL